MKAKLYIILSILCPFTSCDKSKTAQSIYDSTPATIYSMSPEEESERMKDVFGCYGLTLGKTTTKDAKKILKSEGFSFEKRWRNGYKITEKGWKDVTLDCPEVTEVTQYDSEVKHSFDNMTYIHMIFLKDTLSQICVSFHDNSYILEKDLIAKYGQGNGEKKLTTFGKDKKGNVDVKDCVIGYEFRQWQNDDIYIDWHDDRAVYEASNGLIRWNPIDLSSYDNRVFYTSKKMLPLLIHLFQTSYDTYSSKMNKEEENRTRNL